MVAQSTGQAQVGRSYPPAVATCRGRRYAVYKCSIVSYDILYYNYYNELLVFFITTKYDRKIYAFSLAPKILNPEPAAEILHQHDGCRPALRRPGLRLRYYNLATARHGCNMRQKPHVGYLECVFLVGS